MNLEKIMLSEKKPITKDYILYNFTYRKYQEKVNPQRQKEDGWLPPARERENWRITA